MEISSYIKELLLLNDCVVIPDFGGFIANYKPAQVKHNRFNPPSKEFIFNPKLQRNDGLLIDFISEREGIGYFDAKAKIEAFVDETLMKLLNYEKIILKGVGHLYYDKRENLLFEPASDANLLVDSYGLESFSYEKLAPQTVVKNRNREAAHVIFSKRNVKKALVGVPLLLALALIPIKNNKQLLSHSDMNIFKQLTEEVAAPVQAESVKPEPLAEETVAIAIPEVVDNDKYFIIGGSFREEENAMKYMNEMSAQGYDVRNLGIFSGLYRISIQGFSDLQAARDRIKELKAEDPDKAGIWIDVKKK